MDNDYRKPGKEEGNDPSLHESLENLKELKSIVMAHEERPLIAFWGFWGWSLVLAVGSVLSYLFFDALGSTKVFLIIWLPLSIFGGIGETLAWKKNLDMTNAAFSARKSRVLYISMCGLMAGVGILMYHLFQAPSLPLPGLCIVILSLFIFFIAQYSFSTLLWEAFTGLLIGTLFTLFGGRTPEEFLAAGLICGTLFFICGLRTGIKVKQLYG